MVPFLKMHSVQGKRAEVLGLMEDVLAFVIADNQRRDKGARERAFG